MKDDHRPEAVEEMFNQHGNGRIVFQQYAGAFDFWISTVVLTDGSAFETAVFDKEGNERECIKTRSMDSAKLHHRLMVHAYNEEANKLHDR